ncbi:MAG: glycosyl transferase [Acidobacteria bacterium]|nr:glycosyl transferase [Acidobacteriota bacterium]
MTLTLLFLAIGCARIISTYNVFSTTTDEPGHFAVGLQYVTDHVYTLESQHPPLARAMIGLLPYLSGTRPRGISERWLEGWADITYQKHPEQTVFLMRLGNLPFFIVGGLVVFFWARRYFGAATAAVATLLYTLATPVLAHAGLATTDMGLAAMVGAAYLATMIWAEEPTMRHALVMGLCAALAAVTKFTALGFYPLGVLLALVGWLAVTRPGLARVWELAVARLPSFGVAVALGLFAWWAVYLFTFGPVDGWHSRIRVPAPQFFAGIGVVLSHNSIGHPSFLLGEVSTRGWWYYFPVAIGVKTPLALLLLTGLGYWLCWKHRQETRFLLPVALVLGIVLPSMMGHINIGVRHVLPVYLAFSVTAATAMVNLLERSATQRWAMPVAAALFVWLAGAGILCHPDYIPYFNELVRHPEQVLLDSDYDWGQDNKRLVARLHELGAQWVNLGSLNAIDRPFLEAYPGLPPIRGIHPIQPSEGWTAVSPTMDKVSQYGLIHRYPKIRPWFESLTPVERVGTITLYYVEPGTIRRVR